MTQSTENAVVPVDRVRDMRLLFAATALLAVALTLGSNAEAQEVRYSWMELSYKAQDFDRQGSQVPIPDQTVDIDGSDGDGVRFRGSLGIWQNFYLLIDYASTDIDVAATVTNNQGVFTAEDSFDFAAIRGGLGYGFPITFSTHLFAEATYDSAALDFGSFAGEDFDTDLQDFGATLGIRTMLSDDFELRAWGRYTNHETVELDMLSFDAGAVYGGGFGWQIVRGFSIVGEYESGQFTNWTFGFRMDLDED